jgi:hypothetical protein
LKLWTGGQVREGRGRGKRRWREGQTSTSPFSDPRCFATERFENKLPLQLVVLSLVMLAVSTDSVCERRSPEGWER